MYLSDSTSMLAIANDYAKRGLSVFPCHTLEGNTCSCGNASCDNVAKHPLTQRGVYDATNDPTKLTSYFAGNYAKANIAIATGDLSGVIVVDVDDLTALESLERLNGSLPQTWQAETGSGGRHYYFRFDDRCHALKNAVKFSGSLDCRTTGGYVLAPPSLHASGKRYRWIVSPADCELATLPNWLLALIPSRSPVLTMTRAKTPTERLALYLAKCPPAITGQNGHSDTFATVCKVVELFGGLTDSELLDAIEVWNERCEPPWTEAELRHKLNDARAKAPQSIGLTSYEDDGDSDPILTLDDSAFVGLLGRIVRAIEPETEADSAGILLTLLAMFGNVIGKTPSFVVGGSSHYGNLFVALVGPTSSGKGVAFSDCDYLFKRVDSDWRSECVSFGLSSGEGLIERVADPSERAATELIMEDYDPTKTNVIDTMTVKTPTIIEVPDDKRLLCVETEFAKPMTAMRREGNTLSAVLRSAFDCQTLEVMTRGKSKLRASNAYVSIVAHVTPEELKKIFAKSVETDNGFVNRFLWVTVRSTKDLPNGGNVSVLDSFVEPMRSAVEFAKTVGVVKRDESAERLWNDVYGSLKRTPHKSTDRGRAYVLRLSMLLALADCSPIVTTDYLNAALAIWRYCESSALSLFAGDDGDPLAIRLRKTIQEQAGIMRSELRHSISHKIPTAAFESALRWLLDRGDIICVPVFETRQADRYYPAPKRQTNDSHYLLDSATPSTSPTSPAIAEPTSEPEQESSEPTPPTSPFPPADAKQQTLSSDIPQTPSLSLADLLEWKNAHAIRFERNDDGLIWVTNESVPLLTQSLASAIHANQETLAMLVGGSLPAITPAYCDVQIEDVDVGDIDDWIREEAERDANGDWVATLAKAINLDVNDLRKTLA
jgi:hypothetical protein